MSTNNVIRNGNPADCEIHGRSGAALGPTVNSNGWYGGAYGCPAEAVCFCTRFGDWAPGWVEPPLAPSLEGNACPCGANRGADCDCHEEQFREADDEAGGLAAEGLAAVSTIAAVPAAEPAPAEPVRNGDPADCEIHGGGGGLRPTVNSSGWYGGAYGCPASHVCFCTRYGDWEPGWVEPTAAAGGLTATRSEPWDRCTVCTTPCTNTGAYAYGAFGRTCGKGCYDASWEMEPPCPPPSLPYQAVAPLQLPTGCNGCKYGRPPAPPLPGGGALLAATSAAPDGLFVDEREQVLSCPVHSSRYEEQWGGLG